MSRSITREDIAEIHEKRADILTEKAKEVSGIGDEFLAVVKQVDGCLKQAKGYRDIEKIHNKGSLEAHVKFTQMANKTGTYAR